MILLASCGELRQPVNIGNEIRFPHRGDPLFPKRQVESPHANQGVWIMAADDDDDDDDDDDAWESWEEILAKLLRKIDPAREAA